MHMNEYLLLLGTTSEPCGYHTPEDLRHRNCSPPKHANLWHRRHCWTL